MAADANFNYPTEYKFKSIDIIVDGEKLSVRALFLGMEIYENIYMGGITGSVTLVDTDAQGFIEENDIEFIEEFSFEIESVQGETLKFDGFMNGIRNEVTKQQKRMYVVDFNSKATRLNEGNFVTKRFKGEKPHDIAKEMAKRLETEIDNSTEQDEGVPMHFLGSRKKPLDIMKYVLKHGVPVGTSKSSDQEDQRSQTSSGTSGYLFWETLDGIRFSSIDKLLQGGQYTEHVEFKYQTQQKSLSMDEVCKGIIDYSFPQLGDYQSKLRHGAYKSKHISFDWNTGEYREYLYEAKEGKGTKNGATTTKKQKEGVPKITRFIYKLFDNERLEPGCQKAETEYDQTRNSLQQGISRMNSFSDQHGRVTLPPQFMVRAGDTINLNITKISSTGAPNENNKKHSGKYVVKQVSHHIEFDGRAYTQLSTIRSVTQQDDQTSQ